MVGGGEIIKIEKDEMEGGYDKFVDALVTSLERPGVQGGGGGKKTRKARKTLRRRRA